MPVVDIPSGDVTLRAHLATHPATGGRRSTRHGVVVVHGFPVAERRSAADPTYPSLAERIAASCGVVTLVPSLRGVGESTGTFSPLGWREDLARVVDWFVAEHGVTSVWLAGFGTGGTLAACAGAIDDRVVGVAVLGAPVDLHAWAQDASALLARARSLRMVPNDDEGSVDAGAWDEQLRALNALRCVDDIPPRPLLIVHGADDDTTPVVDARALADATHGAAELRIISAAGHRLRHDPRAIAILLGWIDRHTH